MALVHITKIESVDNTGNKLLIKILIEHFLSFSVPTWIQTLQQSFLALYLLVTFISYPNGSRFVFLHQTVFKHAIE